MTATKWQTVEDKEKVLKSLIRFVKSDFNPNLFSKNLYNNLNSMFGHIAHYNILGFYEVWFTDKRSRLEWFKYVLGSQAYGDPAYTRVDIEQAFKEWLKSKEGKTIVKKIQTDFNQAIEDTERAQLARLKEKYES
jgi:hypothetical protein